MRKNLRNWVFVLGIAGGVAGWALWDLYRESGPPEVVWGEPRVVAVESHYEPRAEMKPAMVVTPEAMDSVLADVAWPAGAVEGELLVTFGSDAELLEFIRKAREAGLEFDVEGVLRVVRLRGLDLEKARIARELAGNAVLSLNPYVLSPDVPALDPEGGNYIGFGGNALEWLGIPEDNANWGKGVKVAVLDTGLAEHPSLGHLQASVLSLLSDEAKKGGVGVHGTAVASLVAGNSDGVRGVAPGVDLLSIQVLDASGAGNGFDLARGIIAAVDAGANPIVMSLGTPAHSEVLLAAVNYALERGVITIASAGNEGAGQLLFPARYPGVISVGAVDATGRHLPFSNRGETLTVSAPGFGLTAASGQTGDFSFSGTSAAAPLVGGMVAEMLSQDPTLTVTGAISLLQRYSDDAGPPGQDGYYGAGTVNPKRLFQRKTLGIVNVAVTGHFIQGEEVSVTVQNRGTEPVGNVYLNIAISGGSETTSLGRLEVGDVASRAISLKPFFSAGATTVDISSRVFIPGIADAAPSDDTYFSRIRPNKED